MIWLGIAAAIVAALIVGVMGVGWMLPKAHVASRSLTLRQVPEAVWEAVTRVERAPEWRRDLKRVDLLEPAGGRRRWRESGKNGTLTLAEDLAEPPRRWITRIDDPSLPFGGRWVFELEPVNGGTRLRITEEGEVYHPLFRFMSRFVFGHHATLETYLRQLAARFGESAQPEP
jgi:uncharacterized protein YndB with AHSA1/START domain